LTDTLLEIDHAVRNRLIAAAHRGGQFAQLGSQSRQFPLRSFVLNRKVTDTASPLLMGIRNGAFHDAGIGPDPSDLPDDRLSRSTL
jgi:hypothetical protein